MRSRLRWALFLAFGLSLPAAGLGEAGEEGADPRSIVRLDYHCSSDLGRRQITLFANGTVRLRRGQGEEEEMHLGELGPEELGRFLARLRKVDAVSDTTGLDLESPARGPWVESCRLLLALAGREEERYRFSRLDLPPLRAAQLIQLAEELARETLPAASAEGLPASYRPRIGDVLRDERGQRFRIVGWTADEKGAELDGLDSPVRIYVALDAFRTGFVALEERGRGGDAPRTPR